MAGKGKVFCDDDGQPARMIGVGMDITERKRAEQDARFLADASDALAALVDYESTLQKVARLAVPSFADWCAGGPARTTGGTLRRVAVAHVDPAKVELAHELHRRYPPDPDAPQGVWNILRTGKSEMISEITDDLLVATVKDEELLRIMRELGLKSYMGVPLRRPGQDARRHHLRRRRVGPSLRRRRPRRGRRPGPPGGASPSRTPGCISEVREADRRKDEFLAHAGPRTAQPAGPDPQRPAHPEAAGGGRRRRRAGAGDDGAAGAAHGPAGR